MHNALVKKIGLALKIPSTDFVHSEGPWSVTIPYLKPSDIFSTLISKQPWMLLGGDSGVEAKEVLRTFWSCYEAEHPSHEVFQFRNRLERTIPVTLHGDGGRTQKKTTFRDLLNAASARPEQSQLHGVHELSL